MSAKYRCCACGHTWQGEPGSVTCPQCGHLYVVWTNYTDTLAYVTPDRNKRPKPTR